MRRSETPDRPTGAAGKPCHIVEVAEIVVTDPTAFEAAVARARAVFLEAEGCHSISLHRVIEHPDTYRLIVTWETLDHHLVLFRQSEGFAIWRRLVGPWLAKPPVVAHSARVSLEDIAA